MSKYRELISNPINNNITGKPSKILIDMVSVMCDNKKQIQFTLKEDGSYNVSTGMDAFSNFQMNCSRADLLWEAEDGNWDTVVKMIRTGVAAIENIRM